MVQGPKDLCLPCVLCLICFPGEDFPSQSSVAACARLLAVTLPFPPRCLRVAVDEPVSVPRL